MYLPLFYHSLLNKDTLENLNRTVNLLLGMRSHKGITHESVRWRTCWWNNRVDKHATLECKSGDEECLVHIADVKRNDR